MPAKGAFGRKRERRRRCACLLYTSNRARKLQQFLSQSFHVAEQFTGNPGVYMKLEDTVRSFAEIVDGKCDDLPEQCFRYASDIEDVRQRAAKLAEQA